MTSKKVDENEYPDKCEVRYHPDPVLPCLEIKDIGDGQEQREVIEVSAWIDAWIGIKVEDGNADQSKKIGDGKFRLAKIIDDPGNEAERSEQFKEVAWKEISEVDVV